MRMMLISNEQSESFRTLNGDANYLCVTLRLQVESCGHITAADRRTRVLRLVGEQDRTCAELDSLGAGPHGHRGEALRSLDQYEPGLEQ